MNVKFYVFLIHTMWNVSYLELSRFDNFLFSNFVLNIHSFVGLMCLLSSFDHSCLQSNFDHSYFYSPVLTNHEFIVQF